MPYWEESWDNCWIWKIWISSPYGREIPYFHLSPSRSLVKMTIGLIYSNYIQRSLVSPPGWVLLHLGSPGCEEKKAQACESSPCTPGSSGLSQYSCPRTRLYPPWAALPLSSCFCLPYMQLLSGRICRRKPCDLLMRFPKDSVKLKPGPLSSHKHQGMQQPKSELSLRSGSSFFL